MKDQGKEKKKKKRKDYVSIRPTLNSILIWRDEMNKEKD